MYYLVTEISSRKIEVGYKIFTKITSYHLQTNRLGVQPSVYILFCLISQPWSPWRRIIGLGYNNIGPNVAVTTLLAIFSSATNDYCRYNNKTTQATRLGSATLTLFTT